MSSLATRIELLVRLGEYMRSDDADWTLAKEHAIVKNTWFNETFLDIAVQNIADQFLQKDKLQNWVSAYTLPQQSKLVGIVMAGNIPLVGFHDFLCGYISGHNLLIKLSSKDEILLKHLVEKMASWDASVSEQVKFSDLLKGCDAYIATGSNNSARYFEQYFQKYPHIIRRNRTSVAVLDGTETKEELEALSHDVFTFYGLGCRNVTQLCLPRDYDLGTVMASFENYSHLIMHHKYKNNFDYQLALYMLNQVPYHSNDSLLMIENRLPFSAVGVLHYRFYDDKNEITAELKDNEDIQTIVGHGFTPFGTTQQPSLSDYADGVDTMAFLCGL